MRPRRRRGRIWQTPRDESPSSAVSDAAILARQQMEQFDRQIPEVRSALANSVFGVPVDVINNVRQRGPSDAVRKSLKARGVLPCEAGTDGVVIETVRQIDRAEAVQLRNRACGTHPDPLPEG